MATNTFFGLTTASGLAKAQADLDYWKQMLFETNDAVERFQIENKALKKELDALKPKHQDIKQELADCKTWATHLEGTNKDQAELIAHQVISANSALEESAQNSLLYNQAIIDIAMLKLANHRYLESVRIATDNFILLITKENSCIS